MKITRKNDYTVEVETNITSTIYANKQIGLEKTALEELDSFSQIEGLQNLAFTPDFHKGAGTPIGTVALIDRVYPKVVGTDIGCGMRIDVTNLTSIDITNSLMNEIRHTFFEGGRDIHVKSRSDLLANGLNASIYGQSTERLSKKNNVHANGNLGLGKVASIFDQYTKNNSTRENFLGSIGGGNHFVEIQVVDEIVNRSVAYKYGLSVGKICIMCHSGSLDLGHLVANYFKQKAIDNWKGKHPSNGYFYLSDELSKDYLVASYNAANFATVNRSIMAAMLADVIKTDLTSIYDSPHNLVWHNKNDYLHRKGACPAELDEPVIIPGSMGTRSCIAIGKGFAGTNNSSPHGAGRILNRNASRKTNSIEGINIVTKIDLNNARPDVYKEVTKNLAEESPRSYKDITQVIDTVDNVGIASPVAWLKPLLTIKG